MKEKVRVSIVQFAPKWLQQENNALRMSEFAEQEAKKGADLILFPELANIGYITPVSPGFSVSFSPDMSPMKFASMYIKASEPIPGPTTDILGEMARKYGVYIAVGISQLHPVIPDTLYNSAVLIGPSGLIGIHHKMHLGANEKLFFYPGNTAEVYKTELGNIGLIICYDSFFPELSRILALKGTEITCALWSVPKIMKVDVHMLKYCAFIRALENCNYFLACNRVGTEGDVVYLGHSVVAAPNGIVAYCDSEVEDVLTTELFNERIVRARAPAFTIFRDRRPELYSMLVEPLSKPYVPADTEPKGTI